MAGLTTIFLILRALIIASVSLVLAKEARNSGNDDYSSGYCSGSSGWSVVYGDYSHHYDGRHGQVRIGVRGLAARGV